MHRRNFQKKELIVDALNVRRTETTKQELSEKMKGIDGADEMVRMIFEIIPLIDEEHFMNILLSAGHSRDSFKLPWHKAMMFKWIREERDGRKSNL